MGLQELFLMTFLFMTICDCKPNASQILYGLFSTGNENASLIHYGTFNIDNQKFTLINSLNIHDVGNPSYNRFLTPLAYDPNTDVIYMSARNKQNHTLLSVINATTGSLLQTYPPMENSIFSLQYDIFGKQLFAHVETGRELETQVVEIDTNTGKLKQVLATISQADATQTSSFCPICKKYFLVMKEEDHFIYVAVNSTDGGGISWRTPLKIQPVNMHFDYKTFTMFTTFINATTKALYYEFGVLNRTTGNVNDVIKTLDDRVFLTLVSAYDVAEKIFYTQLLILPPISLEMFSVNVNTGHSNEIQLTEDARFPVALFIKQFIH